MLRKDQLVIPEGPFIEVQRPGCPVADLCAFDQKHAWRERKNWMWKLGPATTLDPAQPHWISVMPATRIQPEMPRLSRKMQRCQSDPLRRQASADIYGGSESATPATQIPRWRWKCHPRQASADVSCHANPARDAESATPAATKGSGVKAPHFHRHLCRYCKCYTCHTNPARDAERATCHDKIRQRRESATLPQTSMQVLQVLHLPHKSSPRCWKRHNRHDKRQRRQSATLLQTSTSATPATQTQPVTLKVPRLPRQKAAASKRHTSANIYTGTASATPATQIQPEMLKVPRQKAAASKRHTSADIYTGTASATPATQIQPEMLKVPRLPRQKAAASKRHTSADIYAGTASATPATQIQPVMLKAPRLPRQKATPATEFQPEMLKVPHLPRQKAAASKRHTSAESATPATQSRP